ncbi:MAG: YceI family protein [Acidobacteriaceae bacterium]|nr:YceI family protein [Acidobacteriaceae bacterium]
MTKFSIAVLLLIASGAAQVTQQVASHALPINTQQSKLTVRAYKTGLFSKFAHDHEVIAPIASGTLDDSSDARIVLRIDARKLNVLDPELPADKRAEVQQTMHSEKVLDSARFPNIEFASTQVRPTGQDRWMVTGNLTLHGETHPVTAHVEKRDGHYLGSAKFKQREFGIPPISIGGGTVKVKDEVSIEFDVVAK